MYIHFHMPNNNDNKSNNSNTFCPLAEAPDSLRIDQLCTYFTRRTFGYGNRQSTANLIPSNTLISILIARTKYENEVLGYRGIKCKALTYNIHYLSIYVFT